MPKDYTSINVNYLNITNTRGEKPTIEKLGLPTKITNIL